MEKIIESMIRVIYDEFCQNDDYVDFDETNKCFQKVSEYFDCDEKCADIGEELEVDIFALGAAFEKQGFIYGFKKAIEVLDDYIS